MPFPHKERINELMDQWIDGNMTFVIDEILSYPQPKACVVSACLFAQMIARDEHYFSTDYDSFITLLEDRT